MNNIGKYLKEARLKKKYSFSDMADETKIRPSFVEAIEKQDWTVLPEYTVVVGFVKSISRFLAVDEHQATALLRRDYPPKKIDVNPKPDLETKFHWGPRHTFLAGVLVVIALVIGYLGFQYKSFTAAPHVSLEIPKEDEVIVKRKLFIKGMADSEATVKVNNQPFLVNEKGEFSGDIEVNEETKTIDVSAVSRSGKVTTIQRKIRVEFPK